MIYAVDFDGTLCKNAWPDIGEANTALIEFLKREKADGAELILWTMREDGALDEALWWCWVHGLTFDAVNDNAESQKQRWGNNPRKVYADCYIDDHNSPWPPWCSTPWEEDAREFFKFYANGYKRERTTEHGGSST